MLDVPLLRLGPDAAVPSYARPGDAGADLVAAEEVLLAPAGGRALVGTGVAVAIPPGHAGFVLPRSGLALHHGVTCLNGPGLIDSGYRGELRVLLVNTDPHRPYRVRRGDRIGQLVVQAVEHVRFIVGASLPEGTRGEGGFGSTGSRERLVPELPEVEALTRFLTAQAGGRVVERAELAAFAALKTFSPPLTALVGRTVGTVGRRGKFLAFDLSSPDPLFLVVHLARGGWIRWSEALPAKVARPGKGPLALRIGFSDGVGFDITEAGTEKRLAVYVVRDPGLVEGIARLGPDPLDPAFDPPALAAALAGHGGQLKAALVSQSVVAGVGNAYSDDALHLARLSPFKAAAKLTADEAARLHAAVVRVLGDAVARSAGRPAAELKDEKRSGMRVHGRTGQACPECGDTVREVSFATKSLQYCPTCQTGGKPLADRRLSRLLK